MIEVDTSRIQYSYKEACQNESCLKAEIGLENVFFWIVYL